MRITRRWGWQEGGPEGTNFWHPPHWSRSEASARAYVDRCDHPVRCRLVSQVVGPIEVKS